MIDDIYYVLTRDEIGTFIMYFYQAPGEDRARQRVAANFPNEQIIESGLVESGAYVEIDPNE